MPASTFHLDPRDEGLLYGHGLFETTRIRNGWPWLWDAHRQRIVRSARSLGMPVDPARVPDAETVRAFVDRVASEEVVVRLNLSAGSPSRPGSLWMVTRPLAPRPESIVLRTSPFLVSRTDPFAAHKTFNYGLRIHSHRLAQAAGADEALLLDTDGLVLETTSSNLFASIDGEWVTPSIRGGVLPGTVRAMVLEQARGDILECAISLDQLKRAESICLTNSGRGVTSVSRLDDTEIEGRSQVHLLG
ncbi:aminotransferase class IV [Kolteria novifilia]|uniref:aminotransferase class IV n=1 Tax=Kolteria novifilia TaxID=2527975 RepID=UPI003AF3F8FE